MSHRHQGATSPEVSSDPDGHALVSAQPPADAHSDASRTAYHEGGHAVGSVVLLGSVEAVSIRPGRGHRGVTLLGARTADTREVREKEIVVTLLGDLAEQHFGLMELGYTDDSEDERAVVEASAALDRLAPLARVALLDAEVDPPDPDRADEPSALWQAWSLNHLDDFEAAAHLAYLRAVAEGFTSRHRNAIRAVAQALLNDMVLDGAEAVEIVRASRCICHRWTPRANDDTASLPAT